MPANRTQINTFMNSLRVMRTSFLAIFFLMPDICVAADPFAFPLGQTSKASIQELAQNASDVRIIKRSGLSYGPHYFSLRVLKHVPAEISLNIESFFSETPLLREEYYLFITWFRVHDSKNKSFGYRTIPMVNPYFLRLNDGSSDELINVDALLLNNLGVR